MQNWFRLICVSLWMTALPLPTGSKAVAGDHPATPAESAGKRIRQPVALAFTDSGKTLLAGNRRSGTVSVIDVTRSQRRRRVRRGTRAGRPGCVVRRTTFDCRRPGRESTAVARRPRSVDSGHRPHGRQPRPRACDRIGGWLILYRGVSVVASADVYQFGDGNDNRAEPGAIQARYARFAILPMRARPGCRRHEADRCRCVRRQAGSRRYQGPIHRFDPVVARAQHPRPGLRSGRQDAGACASGAQPACANAASTTFTGGR